MNVRITFNIYIYIYIWWKVTINITIEDLQIDVILNLINGFKKHNKWMLELL